VGNELPILAKNQIAITPRVPKQNEFDAFPCGGYLIKMFYFGDATGDCMI
jgi:hypothetical protein